MSAPNANVVPFNTLQNQSNPKTCGAKKRDGQPCRSRPMSNGKCRLHGGASIPPGPGHPLYKHGGRSKFWPRGFRKRYEEARRDPELQLLTKELAIVQARIDEKLSSAGPEGMLSDGDWAQICVFLEVKQRLATAQSTIIRQRQRAYTPDEVAAILQGIQKAVNVSELPPEVRERFGRAFARILGDEVGPAIRPEKFPPALPEGEV